MLILRNNGKNVILSSSWAKGILTSILHLIAILKAPPPFYRRKCCRWAWNFTSILYIYIYISLCQLFCLVKLGSFLPRSVTEFWMFSLKSADTNRSESAPKCGKTSSGVPSLVLLLDRLAVLWYSLGTIGLNQRRMLGPCLPSYRWPISRKVFSPIRSF